MDEGYEEFGLEPDTVQLLRLFGDGCEAREVGRSSASEAYAAAKYLGSLDADERAMVIMDMMVLIYTLQSEILDLRMKGISVE